MPSGAGYAVRWLRRPCQSRSVAVAGISATTTSTMTITDMKGSVAAARA